MMQNIRLMAILLATLTPGVGSGAHSPTAWTRGHYIGEEATADDVVAYWSFDEPERQGVVLAADQSGQGHTLSEHPKFAQFHAIGEGRVGKGLVCANTTNAISALRAVSTRRGLRGPRQKIIMAPPRHRRTAVVVCR